MAKDFLFSEALARQILEGKERVTHPSILSSSKGIYHLNLAPIGKGGWGYVYAATHYALVDGQVQVTEPLAIKAMQGNRIIQLGKECAVFEKVHPNRHFEVFEQGNYSYLAMPSFKGVSLWDYFHSHSTLAPEQRYHMAKELLIDLEQMHAKGITHNDLKTKNILFDDSGKKMHIIDFGCALELQSTQPIMRFQTLDKAVFACEFPPEYLKGELAHPSQDIYTMTPILAEIFGVDRKELVRERLNKTFEKIEDQVLFNEIILAFDSSDSLEEALLLKLNHRIHEPEFADFVTKYVDTPYDFSLSRVQLGKDMFDLLNAMQSKEAINRPSAQECLEQLRQVMPEITGAAEAEIDQSNQGPAVPGMSCIKKI